MQKKIHKYPQKAVHLFSIYKGYLPIKNTDLGGGSLLPFPYKLYCPTCREAHKRENRIEICPICNSKLMLIASRVRLPRKKASDREWNKFEKRFVYYKK